MQRLEQVNAQSQHWVCCRNTAGAQVESANQYVNKARFVSKTAPAVLPQQYMQGEAWEPTYDLILPSSSCLLQSQRIVLGLVQGSVIPAPPLFPHTIVQRLR